MAENTVEKPTLLPQECEKIDTHLWIIKQGKYVCEYCFKESESFKNLKIFEDSLPRGSISS